MTNDEISPVTKMQTLGVIGNTSQPPQTPTVHTVVRAQDTSKGLTEIDPDVEEYMAFKKYLEAQRKHKERAKGKKVVEDELDRVSVHTCPSGGSDEEVEAIKIPAKKLVKIPEKQLDKRPEVHKKSAEAIEAKKYHEAFEELDFRSPFTDDINETPVPKGLKGRRIRMYDGTGDLDDHVHNFQWAIKMIPMNPKLWSLYSLHPKMIVHLSFLVCPKIIVHFLK